MRSRMISVLFCLCLSVIATGQSVHAATGTEVSLTITMMRELYSMSTDFDAPIGGTVSHYPFTVICQGVSELTLTITHTNPQFLIEPVQRTLACGNLFWYYAYFTPTTPGLTYDQVTFSTEYITQVHTLIGNGIPVTPADYYLADLGPGTSADRLVYDAQRDLVYISDRGNDQIIVFDPESQTVVERVDVGPDPVGLAISPDNQSLYVANSGDFPVSPVDQSLSVANASEFIVSHVDLDTLVEVEQIRVPDLTPWPDDGYHFAPYEITVVSDTLALLGSEPDGYASGMPIYQLDLVTHETTARMDVPFNSLGIRPVFRTSRDFTATGIVVEPGSSPTQLARYDIPTDTFLSIIDGLERAIAINNNGTRLVTSNNDCNQLDPNLAIYDQELTLLQHVQLTGCQSIALVNNPVNPDILYAFDSRVPMLEIANLALERQISIQDYLLPTGYNHNIHAMIISDDGMWLYGLIGQVYNEPPTQLMAIYLGPADYNDSEAPWSDVEPLAQTQEHTWWALNWIGGDALSGIDHYQVQYRIGEEGDWQIYANTSETQVLFKNAIPGEWYYFRVIAFDRAGNIEKYPEQGYDTLTKAGTDPSGLYWVFMPLATNNR